MRRNKVNLLATSNSPFCKRIVPFIDGSDNQTPRLPLIVNVRPSTMTGVVSTAKLRFSDTTPCTSDDSKDSND